jgi:hypothetical protein
MPAPMEGPFADKMKAATKGREFPKASPDVLAVAESLDLSGGGKTGREKRRAKHERREQEQQDGGKGVSGRSVHTRGGFVEPESVREIKESPELQKAKRLFGEVTAQCEVLGRLHAFMDENGYKDSEGNLSETVATRLERANRTMLPLKEGGVIAAAEVDNLAELLEESNHDIADLKEALEGLESAGELVLPPEIKSLLETKPDLLREDLESEAESVDSGQTPVSAKAHPGADDHEQPLLEKRPYASFSRSELRELWRGFSHENMLSAVERQLADWQKFDQEIRRFHDEERLVSDIRAAKGEEDPEEVVRLTGRTTSIATALATIRKRFEENGRLDKKDTGTLTALFYPYHELLVAAEQIAEERGRETPIVEVEKEKRAKKQEGVAKAGAETPDAALEKKPSFQDKVARLKDLLDQWKALEDEFGDDALRQAVRSLRRLEKREKLPPTGKIAKWFAEHDGPKAWQGRNAAADRALLMNDALPGMEDMVRDGQSVAEKLRKEQLPTESAVQTETKEPVAQVLGLDGRIIDRDVSGELNQTEWQRMNPVEQNRLRRELFSRKDRFVSGLSERLKRAGVNDGDRRNLIIKYLDEYLPQAIELVVKVPLQDTDREILLRDLKKEIAIT